MTYNEFLNWYNVLYDYIMSDISQLERFLILWAIFSFYQNTYETIIEIIELIKKIVMKIGGKINEINRSRNTNKD